MRGWPVIGAIKSIEYAALRIYDNSAGNQRRRSMVAHLFSKLSIPSLFLAELRYPSLSLLASLSPRSPPPRSPSLSLSPIGHDASRLLAGRLPLATMHNTPSISLPSLPPCFSSPPPPFINSSPCSTINYFYLNARKGKLTNWRITINAKTDRIPWKGREELGNATQLYRYTYII